jgi:hypothetical protein
MGNWTMQPWPAGEIQGEPVYLVNSRPGLALLRHGQVHGGLVNMDMACPGFLMLAFSPGTMIAPPPPQGAIDAAIR